jgi:hypothetical protein
LGGEVTKVLLTEQNYVEKVVASPTFERSNSCLQLGAQKSGKYPPILPVNLKEI